MKHHFQLSFASTKIHWYQELRQARSHSFSHETIDIKHAHYIDIQTFKGLFVNCPKRLLFGVRTLLRQKGLPIPTKFQKCIRSVPITGISILPLHRLPFLLPPLFQSCSGRLYRHTWQWQSSSISLQRLRQSSNPLP